MHGSCSIKVDEGHFGETRLDGLKAVFVAKWPGAVHQGNGTFQAIIDENADETQREALRKILHGEETEPGKTVWNVYLSTVTNLLDPLYLPMEFEADIEKRVARMSVPGIVESKGEPIRNPITGNEHRARIDLDDGFEYLVAEMGSGTSSVTGDIPMELTSSYGQFAHLHIGTHGIVR